VSKRTPAVRLSGVHGWSTPITPGGARRYLCLIYDDEKKVGTMSQNESDKFMGEYFAFTDDIRKRGHMIHGEALQPVQTATTVRVRNGKVSTTDGPFAETKEQLSAGWRRS
jgi:hypothetical protein